MPMFRKKPVVIEAVQFTGNLSDHPALERSWADSSDYRCAGCGAAWGKHAEIMTLEGALTACPDDWIITGVKGEHYPCKPDIFAATYEPA